MGFKSVYQLLADVFPQVDARILKAVAIENSKNAEAAVEIVLSEILPYFSQRSKISNSSPIKENSMSVLSDGEGEHREIGLVRRRGFDSEKNGVNSVEAMPKGKKEVCRTDVGNSARPADKDKILDQTAVLSIESNVDSDQLKGGVESDEVILLEKPQYQFGNFKLGTSETNKFMTEDRIIGDLEREVAHFSHKCQDAKTSFEHEVQDLKTSFEYEVQDLKTNFEHEPAQSDQTNNLKQENGVLSGRHHVELIGYVGTSSVHEQAQSDLKNSICGVDGIHPTVERTAEGAVTDSTYIDFSNDKTVEVNNYVVDLTEDATTVSPHGITNCENVESNHMDKIVLLEEAIEDAKNNKKTLFLAMESIMNMMRKVELEEKEAELAKEDASRGGMDILKKVEDLKPMLEHAKEANNMHAGEVYGEKAILATEVRELRTRLLSLSNERDNGLSILDEMRQTLEERLTMAWELKRLAEQEKVKKEEAALNLLAEQEAIMEKVVQEAKILQQEAEENSKLREFLMDRGHVVDTLQGEISVICQDVRLLKEKFDERVPLSQSISSSQTSCILASSGSSLKSIASDRSLDETSKSSKLASPVSSVASLSGSSVANLSGSVDEVLEKRMLDEGDTPSPVAASLSPKKQFAGANVVDNKELLDDGWELCE